MTKVFSILSPLRVSDDTLVSPFLNSRDSESGLAFHLLDGFSLAAGLIEPRLRSKIHVMPFVTQVTFVRCGSLAVMMKGQPYRLSPAQGKAALTEPGVFFQHISGGARPCETLYIVSPAYTFEMAADGRVLYDDSVVLAEEWEELAAAGWRPLQPMPTRAQRKATLERLAKRKQTGISNG
jgi:hypothetical protein